MSSRDYLFEWILSQQMQKRAELLQKRSLITHHYADAMTNIDQPMLAYDQTGLLNLADVRPLGFLVKSRG